MAKSDGNLRYGADSTDSHGNEPLGKVLSQRRHELGLTQEELADLSGVSLRLIHELEHNKVSVRLDNLLRVINALGFHLELARGATHGIVTKSANSSSESDKS
jgi:HTH-type transcriptional regulator/antitoxin HipB